MTVGEVHVSEASDGGGATGGRGPAFWGYVDEIRRRYGSDVGMPFQRLGDRARRLAGAPFYGARATLVAGFVGLSARLALALTATALVGDWAQVPWTRWAVILAFYGFFDGYMRMFTPPLDEAPTPYVQRLVGERLALLPTIVREADIADLAAFSARLIRLPAVVAVGVGVSAAMLSAAWAVAPFALAELDAGTLVLLAIVLFDFGSAVVVPIDWPLMAREARYDHGLYWASPADSPEVRGTVTQLTSFGFATGMWITIYLVLALVLVSWTSPLVLPLAGGFLAFGYATTIANTLGARASVQRIVQRARERRLAPLRRRIEAYGARVDELSPEEAARLRDLLDLHDRIRDAPTTPTASRTLLRTLAHLIVPSILFLLTVSGEVYAERVLDTILP